MTATKTPSNAKSSGGASGKRRRKSGELKRRSKKGKFRETMWFKKGQLDAEAAERAKSSDGESVDSDKADEMPMEDRYADDGSLSHEDKHKFSLRTGHTEMMPSLDQPVSGGVTEDELMREIQGGRGKWIALIAGGAVLLIVLLVVFLSGGGGGGDDEPDKREDEPKAGKKPATTPAPSKAAPKPAGIPAGATAAAAAFAKACVDKQPDAAWALLGPDRQKKDYDDYAAKNRNNRRWRARVGYKGKPAQLTGQVYFSLLMKKNSKWSPCHGAGKLDVTAAKLDGGNLVVPSGATTGPRSLSFAKVEDKWRLTTIEWNKNK